MPCWSWRYCPFNNWPACTCNVLLGLMRGLLSPRILPNSTQIIITQFYLHEPTSDLYSRIEDCLGTIGEYPTCDNDPLLPYLGAMYHKLITCIYQAISVFSHKEIKQACDLSGFFNDFIIYLFFTNLPFLQNLVACIVSKPLFSYRLINNWFNFALIFLFVGTFRRFRGALSSRPMGETDPLPIIFIHDFFIFVKSHHDKMRVLWSMP